METVVMYVRYISKLFFYAFFFLFIMVIGLMACAITLVIMEHGGWEIFRHSPVYMVITGWAVVASGGSYFFISLLKSIRL